MLSGLARLAARMLLGEAVGAPEAQRGRVVQPTTRPAEVWEAPSLAGLDYLSGTPNDVKVTICTFLDSRDLAALSLASKARHRSTHATIGLLHE